MKNLMKSAILFAAAGTFLVSTTVRADEWNKRTVVTVDQPIEIPNQVLPAGTYVFKLLESPSDRHIVQVFDKDEKHLITTVLAIPNYRLQVTGRTAITFWEREAGTPNAIRAWFYPGDNFGQEFAYPPDQAAEIAAYAQQPVVTTTAKADEYKEAEVTNTAPATPAPQAEPAPAPPPQQAEPEPAPAQTAQAAPPPPAETQPQQEAAAPAPPPTPAPPPAELPHTASSIPLIGLIGIFALIGGLATFLAPARVR